jgi:hypothetical protein
MLRTVVISIVLAAAMALPAVPARAQSPDPATLAPPASRGMLMTRPSVPHTGVAPRPAAAKRAHVIARSSGLVSESHGRR